MFPNQMRVLKTLPLACLCLIMVGCLQRDLTPLIPCTSSGVVEEVTVENVDNVDLLFVIDKSGSMAEEQGALKDQLPKLVKTLSSGDRDGDGMQDFPPVKNLRVGVVSTDMGSANFPISGCSGDGDGGRLLNVRAEEGAPAGCAAMPFGDRKFVEFRPDDAMDPDAESTAFAEQVACVAVVGPKGCGFEQQLEAPLRALTPPDSTEVTFNNPPGTGLGVANDNFVRDDSLLVILMVTDEEDCSAADPEVYNRDSEKFPLSSNLVNLRCNQFLQGLHPPERYINGFMELRKDNPSLLVFAAIMGVPNPVPETMDGPNYTAILDDPNMEYKQDIDPPGDAQPGLVPSCTSATGKADPPRRIVEVAQGLDEAGASVTVQSICQEDFGPALDAIIGKIADVLGGTCLPRALNPNSEGLVDCDVIEVIPEGTSCADYPGREDTGQVENGRAVCRVVQRPTLGSTAPTEPGWFYDNFSADRAMRCGQESQRISFVDGFPPATGSRVRLECLQTVQTTGSSEIAVGGFCTMPNNQANAADGTALLCDPDTRSWQIPCANDAQCSPYVCDTTTRDGSANAPFICVNPTCE